ncbi:MAG: ABC exporter membrane fusion protein [Sphaerospermopsis sp. SIO1G1]|nr:ABC exporter membrane fusion protein [Sphaerospermopsis sp. SIO1G1]
MQNIDHVRYGNKLIIGVMILACASIGGSFYVLSNSRTNEKVSIAVEKPPIIKAVTALGRIEPQGEVIQVAASQMGGSNRVGELLVKEGDRINKGQIIAVLDSKERRLAALNQAKQQVKIAESRLDQVKAGAKQGELDAQKANIAELEALLRQESAARKATVRRLTAEVKNAEIEYLRYQSLQQEGAVSKSIRDSKKLTLDTAEASLKEAIANQNQTSETLREKLRQAKATLNRIAEIRPTDIQLAQAEIANAKSLVETAKADLELTYVRSPRNGQVLKINTFAGEIIENSGIVEIGETQQMYVVAEVYETDINRVKRGQNTTITQMNLPGELTGKVDHIGLLIDKKDVLNTDPAADIDARVVEVKIKLDDQSSKRVAGLTNSKVRVAIALDEI